MEFCMLKIPKRIGLFWLFSGCYDNIKGRLLWLLLTDDFFPLAKHVYRKNMHKRKKKTAWNYKLKLYIRKSTQTSIDIFVRPLTSSEALKTSHTILTNVPLSPDGRWYQH